MLAFVHRLHNADDRMSVTDLSKVGFTMHSFSLLALITLDLEIFFDIIYRNGLDFDGLIL